MIKEYEQKKSQLRTIPAGELTSILLCKREGMAFATNDSKAKRFCEANDAEWLDVVDIRRLCYLYGTKEKLTCLDVTHEQISRQD